jgi:hypothetical protein
MAALWLKNSGIALQYSRNLQRYLRDGKKS